MKKILKDDNYFNQNVMENDNFKYLFELLTSSFDLEQINNTVAPVLYQSDNSCFSVLSQKYLINVENHDVFAYKNNETPINCGFINIYVTNHMTEEELKISYYKKNKNLIVSKIVNSNSFTVSGIENSNGVVYVNTISDRNKKILPYRKVLGKTSK